MKFATATLIALGALASAQTLDSTTDIPSCALGCIVTAIQKGTTCGVFDTTCQCTPANVKLITSGSSSCVQSKCSTADAEKAILVTGNICAKNAGKPESTTLDLAALSSEYPSAAGAAATSAAATSAAATKAATSAAATSAAATKAATSAAATMAAATSAAATKAATSAAAATKAATSAAGAGAAAGAVSTVTVSVSYCPASATMATAAMQTAAGTSSALAMFTGAANVLNAKVGGIAAAAVAGALML